jgi:pyrroloquinoline quinone biosynthesis protein B
MIFQPEVMIKVLGTAQDGGIPHVNCYCANCRLAYENPAIRRSVSAVAIILPTKGKWYLIDATPDFREQLHKVYQQFPNIGLMDGILITHAHIGHYTGLMYLGREGISTKKLPIYAGKQMEQFLKNHGPWKQMVELNNIEIRLMEPGKTLQIESGIKLIPIAVPHRNEYSETFGFILAGPCKKLLYIPDIDSWDMWDQNLQSMVASVDYCLFDATFFDQEEVKKIGREDYKKIPHPPVTRTMDLLFKTVRSTNTKVYFTHINHTNPMVNPNHEVHQIIKDRGFYVSSDGMEFYL